MATLLDKYLSTLVQGLNSTSEPIELEVRFLNLEYKAFDRVVKHLTLKYGEVTPTLTEDSIKNHIRQTVKDNRNGTHSYESIIKNPVGAPIFDDRIPIKVSMATEVKIDKLPVFEDPDLTRNKMRYSWESVPNVRFDITKVTENKRGGKIETRYEVELEMIHPILNKRNNPLTKEEIEEFRSSLSRLSGQVLNILRVVQNSDMVYTISEKNAVVNFFNSSTNAEMYRRNKNNKNKSNKPLSRLPEGVMAYEVSVQARDLKKHDIVKSDKYGNVKYGVFHNCSVTVKAEGQRKFLVIHKTGVWLVFPDSELCKIATLNDDWKDYENTILDGEDIPVEHRKAHSDVSHYYLPFDTLVFKNKNVTEEFLEARLKYTRFIRALGALYGPTSKNAGLLIEEKPFYFYNNVEGFFDSMYKVTNYFNNRYETDGFIFTSTNSKYNPQTELEDLKYRTLSRYPDICKWKPHSKLSIDLTYKCSLEKRALYASGGKTGLIEFTGNKMIPFDPETQVDWYHPLFKDCKNDTVLELGPKLNNANEIVKIDGKYILCPIRPRPDKNYPNSIKIAEDVWEDINDPIELSTLLGKDIFLLRKFNNIMKTQLLNDVEDNSLLIDIGCGRGGDISKWKKFHRVLGFDPNVSNLEEFNSRLMKETEAVREKIHIFESGGEETGKIMKQFNSFIKPHIIDNGKARPLYFSSMLSLSFFFNSDEMLNKLGRTFNEIHQEYLKVCRENGVTKIPEPKFIFLTIEKDRTLALCRKYNNMIRFPNFELDYDEETQKISIHLEGTIVENQTEYLVDLDKIQPLINVVDGYIHETLEHKGAKYLNKYEKEITSMYVYGVFKLGN